MQGFNSGPQIGIIRNQFKLKIINVGVRVLVLALRLCVTECSILRKSKTEMGNKIMF